jgi:hypothetical protein
MTMKRLIKRRYDSFTRQPVLTANKAKRTAGQEWVFGESPHYRLGRFTSYSPGKKKSKKTNSGDERKIEARANLKKGLLGLCNQPS